MSSTIKRKLALFAEKFSIRYHRKMKVVRQMETLQELQVISSLGASISRAAKASGRSPDEMSHDQVQSAMSSYSDTSFGRGNDIYEQMPEKLKEMVLGYATSHFQHAPEKVHVDSLAISGGGGKGLFYLSALEHLEQEGVMDQIRTVAGTSAGALTAIPLALGCNSTDLKEMMDATDFRDFFIEGFSGITDFLIDAVSDDPSFVPTNKWFKDIRVGQGKAKHNEREKIVNFLSAIKKVVSNNADMEKDEKKFHQFLNVALDKPISKKFLAQAEHSIVVARLLKEPRVRRFCEYMMKSANEQAGYTYIKNPEQIVDIAVCFARNDDFIEHYFAKLIKQRVDQFAQKVGKERFSEILPNLRDFERESLTLADIGTLARTPEGKSFGFKDLVIGVTQTKIKAKEGSERTKNYFRQFSGTTGLMASSDLSKTDSQELSHSPIKSLARLSMSIPLAFIAKKHQGYYYVDGGLHNNLPTEYFDRYGYNKNVISIVPLTGNEIHAANTVPESLRSSSPYDYHGAINKTKVLEKLSHQVKSYITKPLFFFENLIMLRGNTAYKNMGFRESFRTMLINTGEHGTFTFKVDEDQYGKISAINHKSFNGIPPERSINAHSSTFFDDTCNNLVKLYEHKLISSKKIDRKTYQEALDYFSAKNEEKLATDPFRAVKSNANLREFIGRMSSKTPQLDI